MPKTDQTNTRRVDPRKWTSELAKKAVNNRTYAKIDGTNGDLRISGAIRYMEQSKAEGIEVFYLPRYRVAGPKDKVEQFLASIDHTLEDTEFYSLETIAGSMKQQYDAELKDYYEYAEAKKATSANDIELVSKIVADISESTGLKRRIITLPAGKVLDVSHMKDGHHIKTIDAARRPISKVRVPSLPIVSSNRVTYLECLNILKTEGSITEEDITNYMAEYDRLSPKGVTRRESTGRKTKNGISLTKQEVDEGFKFSGYRIIRNKGKGKGKGKVAAEPVEGKAKPGRKKANRDITVMDEVESDEEVGGSPSTDKIDITGAVIISSTRKPKNISPPIGLISTANESITPVAGPSSPIPISRSVIRDLDESSARTKVTRPVTKPQSIITSPSTAQVSPALVAEKPKIKLGVVRART